MPLAALLALNSSPALAAPAKILHQTQESYIVRMGADEHTVVWQEVGNNASNKTLYTLDFATGRKDMIRTKKRPFGPATTGGLVIFGAGNLDKKVDVVLRDLKTGRSALLHKTIPWIVEPAIQVSSLKDGVPVFQAVWERPLNDSGEGMAIHLYEGDSSGKGGIRILTEGPALRKVEIPQEYHRYIRNEYPELSGDTVAFQNDEYGIPGIYRINIRSGAITRLSPSLFHQERPAIDGPFTAWEESENGFAISNVSALMLHDARTGQTRKLNAEPGFHYQARVLAPFVVYGAKREPFAKTPSIRIYDLEHGAEIDASRCFAGAIFDWAPTQKGLFAAQKFNPTSSRLLFATWDNIRQGCQD